jgi:hypothetical protein
MHTIYSSIYRMFSAPQVQFVKLYRLVGYE